MARQTDHVEEGESLPRCGRQRCEVCVSTKVLTGRPESRRKMLSVDFAHAQACIHKESFISSLFPTSERRCCGCSSPYPAPFLLAVVQSKKHNLENRKHWALSSGVTQAFLNAKTEKLRWVIHFRIVFSLEITMLVKMWIYMERETKIWTYFNDVQQKLCPLSFSPAQE